MACSFWASLSSRSVIASIAALSLVAATGCSDNPYDLAAVSGKVVVDGRPFTDGKVMFSPIAKGEDHMAGRFAIGRVNANGEFTLGTYKAGDGAIVGQQWVTLIHVDQEPNEMGDAPPKPAAPPAFVRLPLPTPVTVVAGEENHFDLTVTKDEVMKLGMRK